jgi:hypothetical protein
MKHTEDRLEALKQKRELVLSRLNARIAEEQRKEDSRARKEETRHKIIVGACLLADMEDHPEVREAVLQSLRRTATERDVAFLKTKGWRLR